MTRGHKVRSRFLIQGAAQGGSALCGFAVTLVYVHALGPAGFGAVSVGLAALTFALVIANFGGDIHATQLTAHDPSTLAANDAAVRAVRLIVAVPLLAIIAALCLTPLWDDRATKLAVALFSLSILANVATPLWAAQALEDARVIAAATLGAQVLNLALALVAWWSHWGIAGFAGARLTADLVVATGLSRWVHRRAPGARVRLSLAEVRTFFRDSAPLALSQILRTLALGVDLLILDLFVSAAQVGIYAVPYRIFALMISISGVYTVVILPSFVRSAAQGSAALRGSLTAMLRGPLWCLVAVLGLIGLAAPMLLSLAFGAAFVPGTLPMRVLLIAAVLNFLNRCYRCVILAGRERVGDMQSTVVGTGVGLAAKLVLIAVLGPIGAALGMVAGEATQAILQRRLALKAIGSIQAEPARLAAGG